MMSMWRPRYFAVVSRHEKVVTAPHISAMPRSRARRALAASRACTADSGFMGVAACQRVWRLRTLARLTARWQMAARMAAMPGGGWECADIGGAIAAHKRLQQP